MPRSFLPVLLLLAGCSTTHAQSRANAPAATPEARIRVLFPPAQRALTLQVGADRAAKLSDLVNEFSRSTGTTLVSDPSTRAQLESLPCGVNQSVEVPAAQVYAFTESLLAYHGFTLFHLRTEEPRLLAVVGSKASAEANNACRPFYVPIEELAAWEDHPAFFLQTVVSLPNTDARTLSNSLRQLFNDPRTQVVVPVGSSNSILVAAPAATLRNVVAMLQRCDDEARQQRTAKAAEERPAPPPAAK